MKNLKRILATVLALTMVLSMVSVSVFAEDVLTTTVKFRANATDEYTKTISATKAGKTIYADIYVPANAYKSLAVSYASAVSEITEADITVNVDGSAVAPYNARDKVAQAKWSSPVTIAEGTPLMTIKIVIPEMAASNDVVLVNTGKFSYNVTGVKAGTAVEGKINILDSFAATKATAITKSFGLGTDVLAELAKENIEVTSEDGTKKEAGYTATWTAPADFDADKKGTYTFTGAVNQAANPDDRLASFENITVTATVTIESITLTNDMVAFEAPELGIKQDEEATEAITAAAALAHEEVVEVLPTTVAISKDGAYEEEATIAWAVADASATLDLTKRTEDEAANKIAIVGTVTPAADGNYTGTATVNAEIIVVPAQIAGAKVEVKNANTTTVPQVTITVPASEVKDANEVIVTITDGETTKEQKVEAAKADFVIDDKGTEDDATDDTAKLVVKFDEKYNKLGYENGDVITVGVTLNGAALADEEGAPLAIEKTVKKPVSSNSGSNVPTNTVKPDVTPEDPTEDPKDDPTTPDEPVVKPDDPVQVPQTEAPFVDVPADHWAAAPVAQLKEAGVVNGSGDGNFAPEADITRAEFTKMVVGVMGLEVAAAEVAFEDCTAADWFTPYVAAAVEAGLVNGVSETEFAPNATITREQAFAIIGRAIDAEATTAVAFEDAADIDEYAAPYVALLVELGIVGGYDDNTIRPDANITRAEAAKLLAGFMDKLNADAEVLPETEEVVEEATEEVVEEEATEEVVEEEATEEVVDEK